MQAVNIRDSNTETKIEMIETVDLPAMAFALCPALQPAGVGDALRSVRATRYNAAAAQRYP